MATYFIILAWEIPWTEEPGGLSPWGQKRVGRHLATKTKRRRRRRRPSPCARGELLQACLTVSTVACQAPLSMGFSRQEYWGGFLCPPPGHLPDSEIEPASLISAALAGGFFTTNAT